MLKIVDLLVRKDEYTHEAFVDRWQGEHAALAKDLPGLRGYKTSVPLTPDDVGFDGVLELYFDDPAALNAAFDSDVGETVMADAAEFIDLDAGPTLVVEETVHVPVADD
jgi:uncharacterized protein (TIGR02118 family)